MKKTVIVAGMAYGDESKGATVDFLCRHLGAKLIVRYNGGHQAEHNVVLADGRHHTFSQFGSGTFIPGVRTHLSRFMLVNPVAMMVEEVHLRTVGVTDAFERLTVDRECVVVTPYHRAFNRLEEMNRGHRAHGSCGLGVGCARRLALEGLALRVKDLGKPRIVQGILTQIRERLVREAFEFIYRVECTPESEMESEVLDTEYIGELHDWYQQWVSKVTVDSFEPDDVMVFEGAQGVLLDETHGVAPYTTWTNCTFENAFTLLAEADVTDGEVVKMGCWRSYFTRHGNGPFPSEGKFNDSYWNLSRFPEQHNTYGRYEGHWRIGGFNYAQAKFAAEVCGGIDEISVSHLDCPSLMDNEALEYATKGKVTLEAWGPRAEDRRYREREICVSHATKHGLKEAT